ncbi:MAG: DNA-processing protein DprA [Chloroflexota bacterium]
MERYGDLPYRVAFSRVPGIGRARLMQLESHFGDLHAAWEASEGALKEAGLDTRTADAVVAARAGLSLDAEMERLERCGVTAVPCRSPHYPSRLKEIHDYPPVLYIRGTLPPDEAACLAVVGTRRPTMYGRQVTQEIVGDLARQGIVITSGLAVGIDSMAHRAALDAGGITVAVLAFGLDIVYPADNLKLARDIMERGALVSEHPPGVRPKPESFHLRNRIMSGLSLGTLVIEAGERSGALITANHALEQNREVFAVPGTIVSGSSKGTNRLIQEGAKLVRDASDVMVELNLSVVAPLQQSMMEFMPESEAESTILGQLSSEPSHIDEICHRTGLAMRQVSSTLAVLELKQVAKQVGSMHYVLARSLRKV